MVVAVDFDGTIVVQDGRPYADVTSPFQLILGAREGLRALKAAGHTIILWSGRANLALRRNALLDPLVRAGKKKPLTGEKLARNYKLNEARYQHMLAFARDHLAGLVDAVDDGTCGKVSADLFIDDKALRLGPGNSAVTWADVVRRHGARFA